MRTEDGTWIEWPHPGLVPTKEKVQDPAKKHADFIDERR
jgi:hypothetical protein